MNTINSITCPTCHSKHEWQKSKPWSPFCSKRCKLIDLGDWASEKNRIAGEKVDLEQEQALGFSFND